MMDASSSLHYTPLDAEIGEIRLVHVEHASENSQPIRLVIRHATLTDDLEFNALSYIWGPESPSQNIELSGSVEGTLHVRQNLYDFLCEMQREKDSPWLWVDQICINQQDKQEKAQQVSRMSEVYTKARHVLIWLGPSFEGSNALMDYANLPDTPYCESRQGDECECAFAYSQAREWDQINDAVTTLHADQRAEATGTFSTFLEGRRNRRNIRKARSEIEERCKTERVHHAAACRELLRLDYWRRVWIIQELALASSRVVRLGAKSVPWQDLEDAVRYIESDQSLPPIRTMRFDDLSELRGRVLGDGKALTWFSLVFLTATGECQDVRDRAYGVLSLLKEQLRIYPDYQMQWQQTVVELTRKQVAEGISMLEKRPPGKSDHTESGHTRWKHWMLVKESTYENVAGASITATTAIWWYLAMSQRAGNEYDPKAMRSFIRKEVLAPYRSQRIALGSKWGSHPWAEKLLLRLHLPRKNGIYYRYLLMWLRLGLKL